MRKKIVFVCIILIAVLLTSCKMELPPSGNSGTTELEVPVNAFVPKDKTKYTIYYSPSAGVEFGDDEVVKDEDKSSEVSLEKADSKVFFFGRAEVNKPDNVDEQYTFSLNGKTYALNYNRTYETAISSSKKFSKYGKYISYFTDMVQLDIRPSTNEILFFSNLDEKVSTASGDMTEDRAKTIADETLISVYGDKATKEYEYDTIVYTNNDLDISYTVVYRKFVWGIPTNDAIQISVNMKGEILCINALQFGMYASAENDIKESDINNALNALKNAISDTWPNYITMLIVDSNGDYYIYAQASRRSAYGIEGMSFFINVV